jgi:type IV fimbrial biogenesis protein FimT
MNNNKQTGFTLYELLITVLIIGVILALGIPNLRQFTQNSRMTGAANDLTSAFHLARSEASRAKATITVCASANSMEADANCGGTWDQGYIVFVDAPADLPDILRTDLANEPVLRAYPGSPEGVMMAVANDAVYFSFAATGLGRSVGSQSPVSQIVLCDDRGNVTAAGGNSAARLLNATPLGRTFVLRDIDSIDIALGAISSNPCP